RRHQDFIEAGLKAWAVASVIELCGQLRQAASVVIGSSLLSGGPWVEIVRQLSMKVCLRLTFAVAVACHLSHLSVEEMQQRLVINALLDEKRGELAVEAHPDRWRQCLCLRVLGGDGLHHTSSVRQHLG